MSLPFLGKIGPMSCNFQLGKLSMSQCHIVLMRRKLDPSARGSSPWANSVKSKRDLRLVHHFCKQVLSDFPAARASCDRILQDLNIVRTRVTYDRAIE